MAFVVTAVATAVELGTAAAIATAVSEVGIAMSVVGAVTGNRDLMRIGSVLGIAGGIGSLAASVTSAAGSVGEAALTEGGAVGAANAATEAGDLAGANWDAVGSGVGDGGASSAVGGGAADAAGTVAPTMTDATTSLAPADASLAPTTTATAPTFQSSIQPTTTGLPGPADISGAQAPTGVQDLSTPMDSSPAANGSAPSGDVALRRAMGGVDSLAAGTGSAPSYFDQFSSWVQANPKLAQLGMQAVGGALKGAADASLANRRMDQYQQQINQTSYGNQIGVYSPRVSAQPGIITGALK